MKSQSLSRYALALFNAAKPTGKLEKIYQDMDAIRKLATSDASFKLFLETPGIRTDQKQNVIEDICKAVKAEGISKNFISLLIENKRLASFVHIIEMFEEYYRKDLGQILCTVTSAVEITNAQRKLVEEAISARMNSNKLVVSYEVSPSILGGLVVKVEDQVFDQSVSSKLDRLKTQLLQPLA